METWKNMKQEHAKHNEDACHYLNQSGKYNDWVITTAFYSAMHYVQYELFSMEVGDKAYDNSIKAHLNKLSQTHDCV